MLNLSPIRLNMEPQGSNYQISMSPNYPLRQELMIFQDRQPMAELISQSLKINQ